MHMLLLCHLERSRSVGLTNRQRMSQLLDALKSSRLNSCPDARKRATVWLDLLEEPTKIVPIAEASTKSTHSVGLEAARYRNSHNASLELEHGANSNPRHGLLPIGCYPGQHPSRSNCRRKSLPCSKRGEAALLP
jgi:hypothetical protein